MKNRISILILAAMVLFVTAGVGGLMSGCANSHGNGPKTQKPSQVRKEHRDDPNAVNPEHATFEIENLEEEK